MDVYGWMDGIHLFFKIIFPVLTVFFEWMEKGWKFSEFQPF